MCDPIRTPSRAGSPVYMQYHYSLGNPPKPKTMPTFDLSPFQKEKLAFFFNFYEPNENGFLDRTSLDRFMKRVIEYTGWDVNGAKSRECREIHEAFFEILFEKQGDAVDQIDVDQWLAMWAGILPGCMGIANFPVWLRLLPKKIFQMIDRNNDLEVGPTELIAFYRDMVRIEADEAKTRALDAFDQMTDEGRHPLNIDSYEMIFSNFLIGRTPYGPGRHIFGCFEHEQQPFKLIQYADDDEESSSADSKKSTESSSGGSAPQPYERPKPRRQGSTTIMPKKL